MNRLVNYCENKITIHFRAAPKKRAGRANSLEAGSRLSIFKTRVHYNPYLRPKMSAFKRLVKMTFRPEEVDNFLEVFANSSPHIRAFPGCLHLELWRGKSEENVLFTFSRWENEQALENYRQSELFRSTWAKTKPLFAERAAAWSVDTAAEL